MRNKEWWCQSRANEDSGALGGRRSGLHGHMLFSREGEATGPSTVSSSEHLLVMFPTSLPCLSPRPRRAPRPSPVLPPRRPAGGEQVRAELTKNPQPFLQSLGSVVGVFV